MDERDGTPQERKDVNDLSEPTESLRANLPVVEPDIAVPDGAARRRPAPRPRQDEDILGVADDNSEASKLIGNLVVEAEGATVPAGVAGRLWLRAAVASRGDFGVVNFCTGGSALDHNNLAS